MHSQLGVKETFSRVSMSGIFLLLFIPPHGSCLEIVVVALKFLHSANSPMDEQQMKKFMKSATKSMELEELRRS